MGGGASDLKYMVTGPADCSDLQSYETAAAELRRLYTICDRYLAATSSTDGSLLDRLPTDFVLAYTECRVEITEVAAFTQQQHSSTDVIKDKISGMRELFSSWTPQLSELQPMIDEWELPEPPFSPTGRTRSLSHDPSSALDGSKIMPHQRPIAGLLYTWGRGSDGQLGQSEVLYPEVNCALPHPVRSPQSMRSVVQIACGGGQQGCTAAVGLDGRLYTFGNNYKCRLGHGSGNAVHTPRAVVALQGEQVVQVACGSGTVFATSK